MKFNRASSLRESAVPSIAPTPSPSLEDRIAALEAKVAALEGNDDGSANIAYITELARQTALGNRAAVHEHNRRWDIEHPCGRL